MLYECCTCCALFLFANKVGRKCSFELVCIVKCYLPLTQKEEAELEWTSEVPEYICCLCSGFDVSLESSHERQDQPGG